MCGIAGIFDRGARFSGEALQRHVRTMTERLARRGPDGSGIWLDAEAGIALGHRRLAIIDLSPTGAQPMASSDGRFVLTYNGELYNYQEIRRALEASGYCRRGESDTEVFVEAIAKWGIDQALERANGMFAVAVWDRVGRNLTLARDRLGIKPLVWAQLGETFVFGSELKALEVHPLWQGQLDREAAAAFLRYNNVPAPQTIYAGVHKLEPGTFLVIGQTGLPSPSRYWSPAGVALDGAAKGQDIRLDEAAERLDELLRDVVRGQMVSDVPIGAFLSGGIDSSTVAAMMIAAGSGPVRTFTIGFEERSHDESEDARLVASHLGTRHEALIVTSDAALAVVPRIPEIYDEPFADSSQIPTILLSEMTRRHVTVALSGDGGDEVFAGYNRHRLAAFQSRLQHAPEALRRAIAACLRAIPSAAWDGLGSALPRSLSPPQLGDKMHKLAAVLTAPTTVEAYRRLTMIGPSTASAMPDHFAEAVTPVLLSRLDPIRLMQYLDLVWYLPNDVLTKVDRASMAVGLEVRVPLLDHRVVEFAWGLPASAKLHRGTGKRVLRRVLQRYVPPRLTARPKAGFAVPIGAWLRGPLREWAEDSLSGQRLRELGLIDPAVVGTIWDDHAAGRANHEHYLWNILMLSTWLDHDPPASPSVLARSL
jgi:asparagine synthase (glutamine-hydrolysing)